MIIHNSTFEISAVRPSQWPEGGLPEFAFIGRSNVGKSTLLNRLLNRKNLARVSSQPGKTRQINFFAINEQFRFVDLPGYGYAAVSKRERSEFASMIDKYLLEREPLCRIVQLVDIRHEPSKDDVAVHEGLAQLDVPLVVVATKLDKIGKSQVPSHVKKIRQTLQANVPIYPVSAEKRLGLDELWALFESDLAEWSEQEELT
ncbi:ribosome biogenesis GTP-binding protein YihA/YsxC [Alicyclobacillus fastidiosus]|uniref:Probable GTP-binding protein EngB n=1 Tax=Alicyclobacillus fastidiosus TaxID=392011 RepID=A0ABV5AFS0_9BACL|nr:ribosome biogenesis GTP-binding protein YihA/YsxC [Alicyclobacillus fastidiosus]WEH11655.1 ribosome biogenesis GTP-binding protein YihA/YsxC [Alicyclobacillus fastidiosus]